jgi:hypothetical protein
MASIENHMSRSLKEHKVDKIFTNFCRDMMKPLSDMTMFMINMVI